MQHSHHEGKGNSGKIAERAQEFRIFFEKFLREEAQPLIENWDKEADTLTLKQKIDLAKLIKRFFEASGISLASENDYETMLYKEFAKILGRPLTDAECLDIEDEFDKIT